MRFVLTSDANEFAARTERLLAAHIECNVLATVLINVRDARSAATFAYGIADGDEVLFAALRTAPHPLIASPLEADAGAFVELWLKSDPELDRVTSVPPTAQAIASAWEEQTGGAARSTMSEAMHVLEGVDDPPRPAPGELRVADAADRPLLIEWMRDFAAEAGVAGSAQAAAMVDGRMRRDGLLVWQDTQPVSMVGVTPEVAGVVRVGPVYTPPALRRRGYAGSAVAAASRRALERGARQCMLYTDLDNPTSNKIYAEVGYRRVGDWEEIALERRGTLTKKPA